MEHHEPGRARDEQLRVLQEVLLYPDELLVRYGGILLRGMQEQGFLVPYRQVHPAGGRTRAS